MSNKTLVSFSDSNKLLYKRLYSFAKNHTMAISGDFVPTVGETKGDFFIRKTFDAMFGFSKISIDIKKILTMPDDVDNDALLAAVKIFVIDVMDEIENIHLRNGYVTYLLFNVFESISPDLVGNVSVDTLYSIGRGMIPDHLDEISDKDGLFESCFHLAYDITDVSDDEANIVNPEGFWDAARLTAIHNAENTDDLDKSFRGTPVKTLEELWADLNNAQEQLKQYIIERMDAHEN